LAFSLQQVFDDFLNFGHPFLVLLDKFHLFEFEHLHLVNQLCYLVLLSRPVFFHCCHPRVQVKLNDLLLKFELFRLRKLLLALSLKGLDLVPNFGLKLNFPSILFLRLLSRLDPLQRVESV